LNKIKNRESRIIRNLNHKVSRKIVEIAKKDNAGIKLEELEGIRNNKKHTKQFNYGHSTSLENSLNIRLSWKEFP
jgi:putative transposase